jgi:hypothetical protein
VITPRHYLKYGLNISDAASQPGAPRSIPIAFMPRGGGLGQVLPRYHHSAIVPHPPIVALSRQHIITSSVLKPGATFPPWHCLLNPSNYRGPTALKQGTGFQATRQNAGANHSITTAFFGNTAKCKYCTKTALREKLMADKLRGMPLVAHFIKFRLPV